jgi:hypothetical protein
VVVSSQMRTFPKSLTAFRKIVNERGERLRRLTFDDLKQLIKPLEDGTVEHLRVESRPASIGIIVEFTGDGTLRVVVQGFMKGRFLGSSVALDGFYKHPDGSVTPMPKDEFSKFD